MNHYSYRAWFITTLILYVATIKCNIDMAAYNFSQDVGVATTVFQSIGV